MPNSVSDIRFPDLSVPALEGIQKDVAERILKFSLNGFNGPFNMMLRSPETAVPLLDLSEYLRFRTEIPPRLVEFAILVHARLWDDQYEWDRHVGRAQERGVTASVIEDIRVGRRPETMPADEASIFGFCVELLKTHSVAKRTFSSVRELLGEKGVTDLTIMLGQYATISMILSVSNAGAERSTLPQIETPFLL